MSIRTKLGQFAITALLLTGSRLASCKGESIPPKELVRQAIQNELAPGSGGRHFMFKQERTTAHLTQTKLLVETKDATAGLLIAQDGRPLNAQQRQQEEQRLANYAQNPDELSKKRKQEREDDERTERILRAFPDAFIFEPEGTQKGTAAVGRLGEDLVRLKFRPNPAYVPPTRVEQVLTGMQGHLLIDGTERHVAEIDGTLEKDVGFGWGILGHLDRGGRFLVQQAEIGDHQWEITRMELSFTGKILLIKKLSIRSSDVFSDFRPVPSDLTFAQGVELLKKQAAHEDALSKPDRLPDNPHQNKGQLKNEAEREQPVCCDR